MISLAQVAELVDALGSGSSGCTPVLVRFQSWAPIAFVPGILRVGRV